MTKGVSDPKIAVLDYGIGNLRSAEKALQHVGAAARLVTDPAEVEAADAVVLPGVGAFGACARALRESGLEKVARAAIAGDVPFLAVCIGFQLLYEGSDENTDGRRRERGRRERTRDLPGPGRRAGAHGETPADAVEPARSGGRSESEAASLRGLGPRPWVYFVHSFAPPVGAETVAVCDYGGPVAALVERGNLWGAQFHPEKSGRTGLALLANFVARAA